MKLSTPVIGTKAAGTQELIQDGITGLLYEPDNPEQLAEKIEYLYWNPELRTKLGEKGRDWAVSTFTIDNYTSALLEVIKRTIEF
jgi:glycosyltransferase involved in cell wall biosynthesis